MRIALICLEEPAKGSNSRALEQDGATPNLRQQMEELNNAQTMALARHMRDGGRFAPMIICDGKSSLAQQAVSLKLPVLTLDNWLTSGLKIWRWQKKYSSMTILAIGQGSLATGKRLRAMRGKMPSSLNCAFFLQPPRLAGHFRKDFLANGHCICGSSFVAERIGTELEKNSAKSAEQPPALVISPPGISLEEYNFSFPEYHQEEDLAEGRHFVFGMAASLLPRSGALLVVRAMSALWQKEDLPPWEVRMFGSGPRFEEILDEAQNLGVASRLSMLADQPLPQMTRLCHAWLAPGVSPVEMPEVLWSGMAAGLPVICVQSQLHRERMQLFTGNTALRVEKNNPQEMAKAMIGLMRDQRLRQRLAAAAIGARRKIGLDSMASRICALLESWQPDSHGARDDQGRLPEGESNPKKKA